MVVWFLLYGRCIALECGLASLCIVGATDAVSYQQEIHACAAGLATILPCCVLEAESVGSRTPAAFFLAPAGAAAYPG